MKSTAPEQLLNDQIATCLAAMQDCLGHSRAPRPDDPYGHQRQGDLAYVAKLMKASARLTEALARLRGESRHAIHVTRETVGKTQRDKGRGDKGEGG